MLLKWYFICILQVRLVTSLCNDTKDACERWGLDKQNECIHNPGNVPCNCISSCQSVSSCPGNVTDDKDCKCRKYATDGDMDQTANDTRYLTNCSTTYNRRINSGVKCTDILPSQIDNGVRDNSTLKEIYRYMDQVKFDCVPGYRPSGYTRPTLTCDYNGEWYWGAQTGNTTCVPDDVVDLGEGIGDYDEFEPGVKEAKGAAILGTFGILVIVGVVGCIVGLDCVSCRKHCKLGKRNTRSFRRWFRRKRIKQTDKQEPPIESTELKAINGANTPVDRPCSSNKENETVPTNKTVKYTQKRTTTTNGTKSTGNGIQMQGVGGIPKGMGAVAPGNKKKVVNSTSKYSKPPIKKIIDKPKQFLQKTKTSVV